MNNMNCKHVLGLLLAFLLFSSQLFSASIYWTGASGSGIWHDPQNWQGNIMPGSTDVAVFDGTNLPLNCSIQNDVMVQGLTVSNYVGGTITLEGRKLVVGTGGLKITSGRVVNKGSISCWGTMFVDASLGGSLDNSIGVYLQKNEAEEPFANATTKIENQTYTRSMVPLVPISADNEAQIDNLGVGSVMITTQYFDSRGRSIQSVSKQASPDQKDLVSFTQYDEFGRTPKSYLPYVSSENTGLYKDMTNGNINNVFAQQKTFYTSNPDHLIPKTVENTAFYTGIENNTYSEVVYESGPLSRVVEAAAPGNTWRLQANGAGKTIKTKTYFNSANEVLWWTYDHGNGNATANVEGDPYTTIRYYPANSLYVTEITDEEGNKTLEYKEATGKIVLTKKQKDASNFLLTYYIYDYFGRIVYIIPPKAVAELATQNRNITYSGSFTKKYLSSFKYDERGRVKEKQMPGAEPAKVIYDILDRAILSQDGEMRKTNKWKFEKFDAFSRPVMSGLIVDTRSQTVIQDAFNTSSTIFEKKQASTADGYSNQALPILTVSDQVLAVSYYDNYDIDGNGTNDYSYQNAGLGAEEPIPFSRNVGMPTMSKVRNMENLNIWLTAVGFFDRFGHPIQTIKNNHLNTALQDVTTLVYNFGGLVTKTKNVHTPGGSLAQVTTHQRYTYDHTGRTLATYHKIDANPEVMLSSFKYNQIGTVIEKNLHSENGGANYLQSIDYRYNIRGWLRTINNSRLAPDMNTIVNPVTNPYVLIAKTNDDANDLFGMELVYDTEIKNYNGSTYTNLNTPKTDGTISAQKWKIAGGHSSFGNSERTYLYNYDKLGRLTNAVHATFGTTWTTDGNKLKEEVTSYDDHGNIINLNRYDANGATGTQIDQLQYVYDGNKLTSVNDVLTNPNIGGFKDGAETLNEYSYVNDNGNMTADANKGITNIEYNFMSLVRKVTFTNGSNITFTYNAAGVMLRRQEVINSITTTIDYVDGFMYRNNVLISLNTSEGRVEKTTTSWNYVYDIKDHVGNVRVSFDKDAATGLARLIQEEQYYPFGLRNYSWRNGTGTDFLMTGKEWMDNLALYDFGARMYDPALGRWFAQDPMYQYDSPYVYCGNNPVSGYDPTGMKNIFEKAADDFGDVIRDAGNSISDKWNQYDNWYNENKETLNVITAYTALAVGIVIAGVVAGPAAAGVLFAKVAGAAAFSMAAWGGKFLENYYKRTEDGEDPESASNNAAQETTLTIGVSIDFGGYSPQKATKDFNNEPFEQNTYSSNEYGNDRYIIGNFDLRNCIASNGGGGGPYADAGLEQAGQKIFKILGKDDQYPLNGKGGVALVGGPLLIGGIAYGGVTAMAAYNTPTGFLNANIAYKVATEFIYDKALGMFNSLARPGYGALLKAVYDLDWKGGYKNLKSLPMPASK